MTQDNLLSTLRAILIIAGSYVVGHNVFGHAVDASTWQIVAGAIVTIASTIWGIAAKNTTIEGVESAVRSVITSIGGLFVSAGVLSGDNLNAILGLVTALAPAVQSALSKSKSQQIATGSLTTTTTGKVNPATPILSSTATKTLILFLVCSGLVGSASAQSPFKPEPKVIFKTNPFVHAAVAQTDSFVNVWRFTGNVAVYNYTFGSGGGSSALTGAEYGYEHQKWDRVTNAWDVLWSVNAAWFPINTALPLTLANMQTFGATFGFKNPIPVGNSVIQIGPDFNPHAPKSQQWGILATVGILFN